MTTKDTESTRRHTNRAQIERNFKPRYHGPISGNPSETGLIWALNYLAHLADQPRGPRFRSQFVPTHLWKRNLGLATGLGYMQPLSGLRQPKLERIGDRMSAQ
jgi:hypothetical protein